MTIWIFPAIFALFSLVMWVVGRIEQRHTKTRLENRMAARRALDEGRAL